MKIDQQALDLNFRRAQLIKQILPENWCFSIEATEKRVEFIGYSTPEIMARVNQLKFQKDEDEDFFYFERGVYKIHLIK